MLKEVARQFGVELNPSNIKRVEKAIQLVADGHVHRRSDWLWEVKGTETYEVILYPEAPDYPICNCQDYYQQHGFQHRCKHGIAVLLQLNINQALGG